MPQFDTLEDMLRHVARSDRAVLMPGPSSGTRAETVSVQGAPPTTLHVLRPWSEVGLVVAEEIFPRDDPVRVTLARLVSVPVGTTVHTLVAMDLLSAVITRAASGRVTLDADIMSEEEAPAAPPVVGSLAVVDAKGVILRDASLSVVDGPAIVTADHGVVAHKHLESGTLYEVLVRDVHGACTRVPFLIPPGPSPPVRPLPMDHVYLCTAAGIGGVVTKDGRLPPGLTWRGGALRGTTRDESAVLASLGGPVFVRPMLVHGPSRYTCSLHVSSSNGIPLVAAVITEDGANVTHWWTGADDGRPLIAPQGGTTEWTMTSSRCPYSPLGLHARLRSGRIRVRVLRQDASVLEPTIDVEADGGVLLRVPHCHVSRVPWTAGGEIIVREGDLVWWRDVGPAELSFSAPRAAVFTSVGELRRRFNRADVGTGEWTRWEDAGEVVWVRRDRERAWIVRDGACWHAYEGAATAAAAVTVTRADGTTMTIRTMPALHQWVLDTHLEGSGEVEVVQAEGSWSWRVGKDRASRLVPSSIVGETLPGMDEIESATFEDEHGVLWPLVVQPDPVVPLLRTRTSAPPALSWTSVPGTRAARLAVGGAALALISEM